MRTLILRESGPDEVAALAAAPPPRTVVWLDKLQRYLDGEPSGAVAAIEITSEVEEARLSLMASADRHLRKLRLPGSNYAWQVGLTADAQVNAIRPAALLKLLSDMEQQGRTRVSIHGMP